MRFQVTAYRVVTKPNHEQATTQLGVILHETNDLSIAKQFGIQYLNDNTGGGVTYVWTVDADELGRDMFEAGQKLNGILIMVRVTKVEG